MASKPIRRPDGIVVGLSGSHASRAALHWAALEAAVRHTSLNVLTVLATDSEDCRQVNRMQAHLIREAAAGLLHHDEISRLWVHGQIAPTLVEASAAAAVLVIGRHQPRVTADTTTGAVTEHCLRECRCPLVVVSGREDGTNDPGLRRLARARSGYEQHQQYGTHC